MRSSEQIRRTPREYIDWQTEQRRRTLAALLAETRRAREQAAPWALWILDRASGVHRHDLRDEAGRRISCPVAGCVAVRDVEAPHTLDGGPRRRAGTR